MHLYFVAMSELETAFGKWHIGEKNETEDLVLEKSLTRILGMSHDDVSVALRFLKIDENIALELKQAKDGESAMTLLAAHGTLS